jgi:hypothetical protein
LDGTTSIDAEVTWEDEEQTISLDGDIDIGMRILDNRFLLKIIDSNIELDE